MTSPLATPISRFIALRFLFIGASEESCFETPLDSDEDIVAFITKTAANVGEYLIHLNLYANLCTDTVKHLSIFVDAVLYSYVNITFVNEIWKTLYFLSSVISPVCALPRHLRPYIPIQ